MHSEKNNFTVRTPAIISVRNPLYDYTKNLSDCSINSINNYNQPNFMFNRTEIIPQLRTGKVFVFL